MTMKVVMAIGDSTRMCRMATTATIMMKGVHKPTSVLYLSIYHFFTLKTSDFSLL